MSSIAATPESGSFARTDAALDQVGILRWHLYLSFISLAIGGLVGALQALERLGYNLYSEAGLDNYYRGLTVHGVTLAIAFTFTFGNTFLSLTTRRALDRPLQSTGLLALSMLLSLAGIVLASYAILSGTADVLFTFYAPLQAGPLFYIGAVCLVISTWVTLVNQLITLAAWRKDNPGERIPLLAFASITTYLMWFIASLGIAVEVLAFLLPGSLGLLDKVDPQFTRILFWFSGHAIVYFWLLPAYVSWYLIFPKQLGGKLYSDGLVRFVFVLFLIFSIPTGLHHQYTDPGIPIQWKTIHLFMTFIIFFPSLITAFTLMSAIETAGRAKGGKGLFGWIRVLPWHDPVISGQLLAMLVFMLGGATGLINASYTLNKVVHNTAYIPGHFHLTVGTAVALTVMAVSYWLVPYLTGRALFAPGMAKIQPWLYAIGVLIFSFGQIQGGLRWMPRRTAIDDAPYLLDSWHIWNVLTGIGGLVMTVSGVLFFIVIAGTIFAGAPAERGEVPMAETVIGPKQSAAIFDRLSFWVVVAVVLVLFAYGPVIIQYLPWNGVTPFTDPI